MNRKDLPKIIRDLVTITIVVVVIMVASAAFFIVAPLSGLSNLELWLYSTILIVVDLAVVLVIVFHLFRIAMLRLYNWIPEDTEEQE